VVVIPVKLLAKDDNVAKLSYWHGDGLHNTMGGRLCIQLLSNSIHPIGREVQFRRKSSPKQVSTFFGQFGLRELDAYFMNYPASHDLVEHNSSTVSPGLGVLWDMRIEVPEEIAELIGPTATAATRRAELTVCARWKLGPS
jgi:hypothetical protein